MIKNILVAGAFGVAALGAQANEIANGDFESSSSATGSYCYGSNCTVADWSAPLLIAATSGPWGNPSAAAGSIDLGNWVAGIQNNGVLSSDFDFVAGHTYTVTWDDAGRVDYWNHSYDVSAGGKSFAEYTTLAGQAWSEHSVTFTASSDAALTFAGVNTVDGTSFIDNVTVTTTAVPEPTSLLMMAAATLGLLAWRRRTQA